MTTRRALSRVDHGESSRGGTGARPGRPSASAHSDPDPAERERRVQAHAERVARDLGLLHADEDGQTYFPFWPQ